MSRMMSNVNNAGHFIIPLARLFLLSDDEELGRSTSNFTFSVHSYLKSFNSLLQSLHNCIFAVNEIKLKKRKCKAL